MIRKSVLLDCAPTRAFMLFTENASDWWPADRRHTTDPHSQIRFLAGGRFYERAADGHEVELGVVRSWEPPQRLAFDFYVGTDADHPTAVEVTFVAEGEGTRITIEHRPTADSAAIWTQRAPRFDRSWELVLQAFVRRTLQP